MIHSIRFLRLLILLILFVCSNPMHAQENWTALNGEWRFALDPRDRGVKEAWYGTSLPDTIQLPGTTDGNRKGTLNAEREAGRLTRLYPYYGAAWYQREIQVPRAWAGKRLTLLLERTKISRLWVDEKPCGLEQNSLVAPHRYFLGKLNPGLHRLTLRIDNTGYPPIGDPHQISDQTQTNWNGIIGRLGIEVTGKSWIEDVQIYPNLGRRDARFHVELGNEPGTKSTGTLQISASRGNLALPAISPVPFSVSAEQKEKQLEITLPLGERAVSWNEFSPQLYSVQITLTMRENGRRTRQARRMTFGLREFKAEGTKFKINGKTTFLRGKHDACVFPLTGYPPMILEGWEKIFQIAQSYGINHYRFHTWCPPEAAFAAADELGIYLQPELPNWQAFGEPVHDEFLKAEGERLLEEYGNHPSFVMLSLGNELGGRQELMAPLVAHFRGLDPRHLYAQGTNNWFPGPDAGDDYFASFQAGGNKIRGSFGTVDIPLGHVQTGPANTFKTYDTEIASLKVPVVSHEIGEYQVAPDFKEIPKYQGVVAARNLEIFRERMEKQGLLDQSENFLRASGALAAICYREDIEAALRTRNFAGFQLLDLQDFPGQGTALVGILNSFMESKGIIEPARWRQFCAPTVPLVRMARYCWTQNEEFNALVEVAHYGAASLENAKFQWAIKDESGTTLLSGHFPAGHIEQGTLTAVGEIRFPLGSLPAPQHLKLEIELESSEVRNGYDLWVYPQAPAIDPGHAAIRRVLDGDAWKVLDKGGRILLLPELTSLKQSVEGAFASDFWNWGMFKKLAEERKAPIAPGTLGIWCQPNHPALREFPTEYHGNWQWFNLLQKSRAFVLDGFNPALKPVVTVIDNYERAHRLGNILEFKAGKGSVLLCAIDLLGMKDRPEARQLLHSLLAYMNSGEFHPERALSGEELSSLLR